MARLELAFEAMVEAGIEPESVDAIVGRGEFLPDNAGVNTRHEVLQKRHRCVREKVTTIFGRIGNDAVHFVELLTRDGIGEVPPQRWLGFGYSILLYILNRAVAGACKVLSRKSTAFCRSRRNGNSGTAAGGIRSNVFFK